VATAALNASTHRWTMLDKEFRNMGYNDDVDRIQRKIDGKLAELEGHERSGKTEQAKRTRTEIENLRAELRSTHSSGKDRS